MLTSESLSWFKDEEVRSSITCSMIGFLISSGERQEVYAAPGPAEAQRYRIHLHVQALHVRPLQL